MDDHEVYKTPDFNDRIKNLLAKVTSEKEVLEGDRFRFGSALLIKLVDQRGQTILLVQWPDGLYRALPYELRAFAASLSVDINTMP